MEEPVTTIVVAAVQNGSTQKIEEKISAMGTRNLRHTVTHVIQVSLGHCSSEVLNFILSHLSEPVWPRTVSTKATCGRQIVVNNRKEALAYFKAANYFTSSSPLS